MCAFFHQAAVRRWLIIAAVAVMVRAVAFLPGLSPTWATAIVIGGAALMSIATVGLSILLGRSLRAQGRLATWETTGLGIMLVVVVLTHPLPKVGAAGWVFVVGWLLTTFGVVAGVLSLMAYQDRQCAKKLAAMLDASARNEEG